MYFSAVTGVFDFPANPDTDILLPIERAYISCDTTAAPVTINLPTILALGNALNVEIMVHDEAGNAAANPITIVAGAADEINGGATFVINQNGGQVVLRCTDFATWIALEGGNAVIGDFAWVKSTGLNSAVLPASGSVAAAPRSVAGGGGNNIDAASVNTDAWGNGNFITDCSNSSIEGDGNIVDTSDNCHVEGTSHIITGSPVVHVEGNQHSVDAATQGCHVEGDINSMTNCVASHIEGSGNTIENAAFCYVGGDTNVLTHTIGTTTSCFVHGTNNTVTDCVATDVVGGQNSVDSALFCTIRGQLNIISVNCSSLLVMGNSNIISGVGSTMVVGNNHLIVTSQNSLVSGSDNNMVANVAQVGGFNADVRIDGEWARAIGRFAENGDAQTRKFQLGTTTNDAGGNTSLLATLGFADELVMDIDTIWNVTIRAIATQIANTGSGDADGDSAMFTIHVACKNLAGVGSLIGAAVSAANQADASAAGWTLVPSMVGTTLRLTATSDAGKTVRWMADVEISQLGFRNYS